MLRPKERKTIEELYGNKLDVPKSQVKTNNTNLSHKGRATERDPGYIITSTTPYTNCGTTPASANNFRTVNAANPGRATSRRKSFRPLKSTDDKCYSTEKDSKNLEESKKEQNIKIKTSRVEASGVREGEKGTTYTALNNTYDNKTYEDPKYKDTHSRGHGDAHHYEHHQHHRHHHNHHKHQHNVSPVDDDAEDKDDDSEEFFALIRKTVEGALGKTISQLLNRNFRELSTKVDSFSAELNNTNALLKQIQLDISNKLVRYGEENSGHFRYLCMKSEYDKMFYQQQTMMAAGNPISKPATVQTAPQKLKKRKSVPKLNSENVKQNTEAVCLSCRSSLTKLTGPEVKVSQESPFSSSSEDLSQKSSEIGMKDVIERMQKYCNKLQLNEFNGKKAARKCITQRNEGDIEINKDIFEANLDDDTDESDEEDSDGMTPRADDHYFYKHGGMTERRENIGGGDA